jgi:hypothetical protein
MSLGNPRRHIQTGRMRRRCALLAAAAGAVVLSLPRSAAAQTLNFVGLQNDEAVENFYSGGLGSKGSGPGPNFGIVFGYTAEVLIDVQNGGDGNESNIPGGTDVCIANEDGADIVMNVSDGFSTGVSFYYTANADPGTVQVFSGLNDTGTLLASLNLPVTPEVPPPPGGGLFDNWQPIGISFSGVAESVEFAGTPDEICFDDITINSATPQIVGTSVIWASPTSGSWDVGANWNPTSTPASNDVTIAPVNSLTVTGPDASATVNSLVLGGGGNVTLALQAAGNLAVNPHPEPPPDYKGRG